MGEEEVFTYQPGHAVFTPAPSLARSRYNRQLLVPSVSLAGQQRIASTRVLVIGLGGLGSPASLYLAGAGVHTLGLVDHDVVEESNLHRQIVHRESSVFLNDSTTLSSSMTKVQSALRGCRELNSTIEYRTYETQLDGSNALDIIKDYDIVLDCTDNPATRYLISDVCVVLGKVLVSGAAQRLDGQVMVLNYNIPAESTTAATSNMQPPVSGSKTQRGPCYRCVFPVPPSPDMVQGCSEIGILGPVVGTIGCLMASEALRLICRPDESRKPSMLLYNAWSADPRSMFRTIGLRGQRQHCLSCGDQKILSAKGKQKLDEKQIRDGTMDYIQFCGVVEDVKLLNEKQRISAKDFMKTLEEGDALVVDVREKLEIELGPKIKNSINIPISRILRDELSSGHDPSKQDVSERWDKVIDHDNDKPVFFVCQRGNDSQTAARKLMDRVGQSQDGSRWIGDVEGGFIAMEKYASTG